ncbi:hypothetical protein FRB97_006324 [Tulasnella sp. 331]|nr:hypothetical protein FRB97_006324 [Tulasnella sp. 331]
MATRVAGIRREKQISVPIFSRSYKSIGLLDLPEDITLQIFFVLDMPSILASIQARKRFPLTKNLYSNAFRNLIDLYPHPTHRLEPLLSTDDSGQVETIVIKTVKLEMGRISDPPKPVRTRDLADFGHHVLLPGGRWLISTTHNKKPLGVFYHYLDAPELIPRDLMQVAEAEDMANIHTMVVALSQHTHR